MARKAPIVFLMLAFFGVFGTCTTKKVVDGFPDSFVGVGLELKIEQRRPVVVRTLAGGPASQAGVEPNDRILLVDGKDTLGANLGTVVMQLRGKPGSQVTLTVDRKDSRIMVVVRRRKMAKGKKARGKKAKDYAPL